MDALLYDPAVLASLAGPGGRVVLVLFCRAVSIFLTRLLEVAGRCVCRLVCCEFGGVVRVSVIFQGVNMHTYTRLSD